MSELNPGVAPLETQPSVKGALWLCYHALKQIEFECSEKGRPCPRCDMRDQHSPDCMLNNGLKAMEAATKLDQGTAQTATPSPTETERDRCRREQSERVMPLVGPLLDAWEGTDLSFRSDLHDQYRSLHDALQNICRAIEEG